ncbi:hypothetical protein CAT723_04940 [Corynebacterium ammoniagenes]|uniref:Integrase catalytic domain-containing protein n=1 Tax=Corynebacterium ammoniagenes TaxID=1697 RepID=A0AAV5G7B7_CORAM|nr:hypothetical protein CAT723_04940 [Corynebacterium ammoniagenes]
MVRDLVTRHFNVLAANEVYVGDITYLLITDGTSIYLATVIDCYSRRLAGFAIADHMRISLVHDALIMAKGQRTSLKDTVFHSDHSSIYTAPAFQDTCKKSGVRQSMGAVGTTDINSLAKTFNPTLRREVLQDTTVFANQRVFRRESIQ